MQTQRNETILLWYCLFIVQTQFYSILKYTKHSKIHVSSRSITFMECNLKVSHSHVLFFYKVHYPNCSSSPTLIINQRHHETAFAATIKLTQAIASIYPSPVQPSEPTQNIINIKL